MRIKDLLLTLGAIAFVAGCGGATGQPNGLTGGSSRFQQPGSGSTDPNAAAPVLTGSTLLPIFLTDNSDGPVEQLWVRFYQVRLSTAKDTVPIFESKDGLWVNLKALREGGKARFFYLGAAGVVPKDVTRLVAEVGPEVRIKRKEMLAVQSVRLVDSLRIDDNRSKLVLNIKNQGANAALAMDFQTARVNPDKSNRLKIEPNIGSTAGIEDPTLHVSHRITGKLTNLGGSSPQISFVLDTGEKRTTRVVVDPSTSVYTTKHAADPKLTEGQTVSINGVFSILSQSINAKSVEIVDAQSDFAAFATGRPLSIDAEKGILTLATVSASGIDAPDALLKLKVGEGLDSTAVDGTTLSLAESLEKLAKFGGTISAAGSWADGILNAKTLAFEKSLVDSPITPAIASPADIAKNADIDWTAKVTDADAKVGTVSISREGAVQLIQVEEAAKLSNASGERLTREQFFTAIAKKPKIKMTGSKDGGIVRAATIQIVP